MERKEGGVIMETLFYWVANILTFGLPYLCKVVIKKAIKESK